MRIRAEDFPARLEARLFPFYLIFGDEPLLVERSGYGDGFDREGYTQKVAEALKRFDLTPNKLPREMATT